MTQRITIYVELLDEGVDTWRPVTAERIGETTFRILGPKDEDETWLFPPGAVVGLEMRRMYGGEELPIAVAPAGSS